MATSRFTVRGPLEKAEGWVMGQSIVTGAAPDNFCIRAKDAAKQTQDPIDTVLFECANSKAYTEHLAIRNPLEYFDRAHVKISSETTLDRWAGQTEASVFIRNRELEAILRCAMTKLDEAFGKTVEPTFWVFKDPDSATQKLMIEIRSQDASEADACLTDFCHDWWFDRINDYGHLMGFRVAASS